MRPIFGSKRTICIGCDAMKVPVLIETEEAAKSQETWICSAASERWLACNYGVIGIVNTIPELDKLLLDIVDNDLDPSIFVVNTYGAKDLLRDIDERACEKPILFLRRRLYAGKSGLHDVFGEALSAGTNTGIELSKMRLRLASCWFYGGKTSNYISKELCERIRKFQDDEDFGWIDSQPDDV